MAEARRLAQRLGKSRSRLYQEAVAEYLARHDPDAITAALDRVARELGTGVDPFSSAAARQLLERAEW